MNSNEKKEIVYLMRSSAKKEGYKSVSDSFYKKYENGLHIIHYVVTPKGFTCYSWIKEDKLDDILWDILNMPENKKYSYSLHVNGAFAAPSILVDKYFYDRSDDLEQMITSLWKRIGDDVTDFMKNNSVEQIVFSIENPTINEKILQCLLYIDKKELQKAVDLAKGELAKGIKVSLAMKVVFLMNVLLDYLELNAA